MAMLQLHNVILLQPAVGFKAYTGKLCQCFLLLSRLCRAEQAALMPPNSTPAAGYMIQLRCQSFVMKLYVRYAAVISGQYMAAIRWAV